MGGKKMGYLKTLIHLHTDYSYDSDITPSQLAVFAESNGFDCIAVTDHDTIDGALHLRSLTDLRVIVGEEVSTLEGHLIGLFLKETVEPGMSARETALAIKDQGGLVLAPHPFNRVFGCGLGEVAWSIAGLLDAVEVNNAQNLLSSPDRLARNFANRVGLPGFVGADSHRVSSIAPCFQLMPAFDGPEDFADALRAAQLRPGRHPLRYFANLGYQVMRHLARRPLTVGGKCACRETPGVLPEVIRTTAKT